jgi:predicted transposase YdaD
VETLLAGGIGTLPLAPISKVSQAELPGVVGHMQERVSGEPRGDDLLALSYVLVGMRYSQEFADILFREVRGMKESSTYQAIAAEGARRVLLRLGTKRFGPPDETATAALNTIAEVERLAELGERVDRVNSWQELLVRSVPQPPRRRRKSQR